MYIHICIHIYMHILRNIYICVYTMFISGGCRYFMASRNVYPNDGDRFDVSQGNIDYNDRPDNDDDEVYVYKYVYVHVHISMNTYT
jgi:hypothetical protein